MSSVNNKADTLIEHAQNLKLYDLMEEHGKTNKKFNLSKKNKKGTGVAKKIYSEIIKSHVVQGKLDSKMLHESKNKVSKTLLQTATELDQLVNQSPSPSTTEPIVDQPLNNTPSSGNALEPVLGPILPMGSSQSTEPIKISNNQSSDAPHQIRGGYIKSRFRTKRRKIKRRTRGLVRSRKSRCH